MAATADSLKSLVVDEEKMWPLDESPSCHDIVAPFSAVGRLLLQARLPGTRCQTISVIRRLAKTLLGDY